MAKGEHHPQPRRQGKMSDWQLYGRLLTYIVPYWWVFALSLLGYVRGWRKKLVALEDEIVRLKTELESTQEESKYAGQQS
mgnify:CR=1 FL=1